MKITRAARRSTLRTGRRGEDCALRLAEACGMILLARNFRCKAGELDLVVRDGREIVFIEVKSRHYRPDRLPIDNLSYRQRKRNHNAAVHYRRRFGATHLPARFDLVEIFFRGPVLISLRRTENYLPPLPPRRAL